MQENAAGQAMKIIGDIQRIVPERENPEAYLNKLLQTLQTGLKADAVACYVAVDDNRLELFGTSGIRDDKAPHTIRFDEGLIGQIASEKRALSATADIGFGFGSVFGAPLLRWNKTTGVILFFNREARDWAGLATETTEILCLFLAMNFSDDLLADYKKRLIKARGLNLKDHLKGQALNKGCGVGAAVVHRRRRALDRIFSDDKEAEQARLNTARNLMIEQVDQKFQATPLGIGEHADILETYRLFVRDKGWYEKISAQIANGLTAEAAVERVYDNMWNRLSGSTDVYLKERLHDLRDVSDRLLSYLSGQQTAVDTEDKDIIIVAQTMGPAELMDYDYKRIRGLIIEDGTPTMHVAIVARALNIPVIARIHGIYKDIKDDEMLAVDGDNGFVYVNPSPDLIARFTARQQNMADILKKLEALKNLPNKTLDGTKIHLSINVGLDFDLDYLQSTRCDGIGLYRTEIPFMSATQMPDVACQTAFYKRIFDAVGNKPAVFRSLDVGSDKLLPYWDNLKEDNPAIGWRSIRITLDRRAILRKQMQALIGAAAGKELNVMFPMISGLSEFTDAKETFMLEYEKQKRRGALMPSKVNVGLMIEVPSVIFQLDDILKEADFISVGTNDLAQFIFACDRGNPRITERYDVLSAPFLRVLREIIKRADRAHVPCSVCGEMAGNPLEAMALIGLGYRRLSMTGSAFASVKNMIRTLRVDDMTDYVQMLLKSSKRTVRPQLTAYAYDHGIAIS